MADRLVAYMPVVNRRHLEWLKRHPGSTLHLISNRVAVELMPRLGRNIIALSDVDVDYIIKSLQPSLFVHRLDNPENFRPSSRLVLADEDVCHAFAEKYLMPKGIAHEFENIWARYDMQAVKRQEPVLPDTIVSIDSIDLAFLAQADQVSKQSPDWWRQIGIVAVRGGQVIARGWNEHFPSEYETDVFGDPRVNFDAGDPAGAEVYLSLHAEEYLVGFCARNGTSLLGASVYINTFPCGRCARALSLTGITTLYFRDGSSFLKGFEILQNAGIRIVQVKTPDSA